ncbi:MAG: hypothetical protein AABX29_00010 [Nanoarchaeota archaeon]
MGMPEDIVGRGTEVRTEADEMELAIKQLCDRIKDLATGGIEVTDTSKKYVRKFTFEGDSYKVIYIPKKDKTDDSNETKEEFLVTKKSTLFLTQPDASTKQVTYGYSLNFVKDSKKGKEKPVIHVQAFPDDIHQIAKEKEQDSRYTPLGDLSWHLMLHTVGISKRIVETTSGLEEVSVKPSLHASLELINEMTQTLSGINPLSA